MYVFMTFTCPLSPHLNRYVCHDLAVSVQAEFQGGTVRRWRQVVGSVLVVILLIWWAIGWGGYLRFYDKCEANILDMVPVITYIPGSLLALVDW